MAYDLTETVSVDFCEQVCDARVLSSAGGTQKPGLRGMKRNADVHEFLGHRIANIAQNGEAVWNFHASLLLISSAKSSD